MKILVTGSSGTIGTRLCQQLLVAGHEVVGADWKPNKWDSGVNDITINIDLRNKEEVLSKLPKDIDIVIHLAANARVYNLVVDPSLARDNFETVFNVLEFTRQNGIKKIVFSSSREVYGNSEKIKYAEDDAFVKNCESPYTASKIAGESLVHSYQQCYGMDFIIFRFSNVYGMYDESDRVVPLFITKCSKNEDIVVYGKEKLLDFTYIDDVIEGIISSIEKFDSVKNDTYNLAYGEGTSIMDVASQIQTEFASTNAINVEGNRTGEVVKYIADISRAKRAIGFNPKITTQEGMRLSIQWYKENLL